MNKNNQISSISQRPPIVVVLGHVDHGKTTLLDYIRKTKVASKEAGGITQSIGASVVTTQAGKKVTFIDTPGHAAFSNMRSRGAKVADIAILVVAADDGVKPQTKEALSYILTAGIPYIIAATKMDLPSASLDLVKTSLEKEGVAFEGKGGDVALVPVSAKVGQGVNDLLEMINLVSELHEVKGDPKGDLEAVVIETGKDKRGPTASLIVRDGTLSVGDEIMTEKGRAKIRGLFDFNNKSVKAIFPGEPGLILGFEELPQVGSRVWKVKENGASLEPEREKKIAKIEINKGKIPLLVKAQNAGSLEALIANLPEEVQVVFSSVGDVTESDVFLAKSAGALIIAFESKIPTTVGKLAETEGVKIETYDVIYRIFEDLEELVKKGQIEVTGKAEIIASFPYDDKKIAGCRLLQGKLTKNDSVILVRGEKEIGSVKIASMKKGKVDVEEVGKSEEFGVLFTPQLDFKVGDVILSVRK